MSTKTTDISYIIRDGEEIIKVKCPKCEEWSDIDQDQLRRTISCICEKCGEHFMIRDYNDLNVEVQIL